MGYLVLVVRENIQQRQVVKRKQGQKSSLDPSANAQDDRKRVRSGMRGPAGVNIPLRPLQRGSIWKRFLIIVFSACFSEKTPKTEQLKPLLTTFRQEEFHH